jgi:hypothetical protein
LPHKEQGFTGVEIQELSTGQKFQRSIPVGYYPHLIWIGLSSMEHSGRAAWLRNLLDLFAEELQSLTSIPPDWRSPSLNPLLVRTFYDVGHKDCREIKATVGQVLQLSPNVLKRHHWVDFYTRLDVIDPGYLDTWRERVPDVFEDVESRAALISEGGMVTLPHLQRSGNCSSGGK